LRDKIIFMKKDLKLEVVIPFYNEIENFIKFNEIIDEIDTQKIMFIFLDNGSEKDEMKNYFNSQKYTNRKLITSKKNLGYGGGIVYSKSFIENEFIAWMPGNLKINPKDSINFFMSEYDNLSKDTLVKAKRIDRKPLDFLKTSLFGILSSLYFRTNLIDAGGTPSIVHKSFFENTKNFPNDFSFDVFVYYFYRNKNLLIIRPKISYTERYAGTSHWQNGVRSEINLIIKIFSYKRMWTEIIKNDRYKK